MTEPKEDRKDQIFAAGAKLFAEQGYERTSLQEVADLLGITRPAFYYYYRSKEQLLFEIMSFVMDRVLADLREVATRGMPPLEKAQELIRRYVGFFSRHPHELTLMSTAADSLDPEHRRVLVEREREYLDLVRGIVAEILGEPGDGDHDTTVVAFALIGGMSWIFKWYDPQGPIPPERLADEFWRIFAFGLQDRPTGGRSRSRDTEPNAPRPARGTDKNAERSEHGV